VNAFQTTQKTTGFNWGKPSVNYDPTPVGYTQQLLQGSVGKFWGLNDARRKRLASSFNFEALAALQPHFLKAIQMLGSDLAMAQRYQPQQQAVVGRMLDQTAVSPEALARSQAANASAAAMSQGMDAARRMAASNPALAQSAQLAAVNQATQAGNQVLQQGLGYDQFLERMAQIAQLRQMLMQSLGAQGVGAQAMGAIAPAQASLINPLFALSAPQAPKDNSGNAALWGTIGTIAAKAATKFLGLPF